MSIEKKWTAISATFTSDGQTNGSFQVADSTGFYVKQKVNISSNTQAQLELQIKRIEGNTISVGPFRGGLGLRTNLTAYLVADAAAIQAPEQLIPPISPEDIANAVFIREPVNAIRTTVSDSNGDLITDTNPLPVSGSLVVDTTETVEPQIFNIDITTANTNVTINLPTNVRRFFLRPRDTKGPLRIYKTSAGPYYTVPKGSVYESFDIKNSTLSLIVQSSQANTVVELFCWVKI